MRNQIIYGLDKSNGVLCMRILSLSSQLILGIHNYNAMSNMLHTRHWFSCLYRMHTLFLLDKISMLITCLSISLVMMSVLRM